MSKKAVLSLEWSKMPIYRQGLGEMVTGYGEAVASVDFPNGEVMSFYKIEIPPTNVRVKDVLYQVWLVDACTAKGVSGDGDTLVIDLDPEECLFDFETFRYEAMPMPYHCTLTTAQGQVYRGVLTPPPTVVDLLSRPIMAQPMDMSGVLSLDPSSTPQRD